jgi:transposase InsO family protein
MAQKKTLADITGPRYRKAGKAKKSAILDEFCQTTGYNRTYAVTLLRRAGKTQLRRMGKKMVKVKITAHSRRKQTYQKMYDKPVEQAVLAVWDFFRRVCGKRLVPMIRANLKALAREFRIPADVQAKLAKASRSTICRMLGRERHKAQGRSAAKPGTLLKQQILVRTFWHWDDKKAGFCEIDTVSHDGGFIQDEYAFTLSLTDTATCWPEFRALRNKAQSWTVQALQDIRNTFPVPLRSLDSDNGAEFLNWHLKTWCEANHITFTRGRQYHKNDNAFIEQKNGDVVRKTIGYGRLSGDQTLAALHAVYSVLNPLYNFFYPNLKCIDKQQAGQKKRRIYEREP